jgi:FkbM family methyltransferase
MTDPTPVETPYGQLFVDPEELVIGRLLQADGEIPDISEEVAFFRKYLKPGDTAIDVGANYGLFTLALAQIVGADGHVCAFEPNKKLYTFWSETQVQRGLWTIYWSFLGMGKERTPGALRRDPRGSGGTQIIPWDRENHRDEDGVAIITLDHWVSHGNTHRPIKAIKIDAEGMDVDVLLGATTILKEDRPAVIFEWNPEAMGSLGKDPEQEFSQLIFLGAKTHYQTVDLNSSDYPEQLRGNVGFLPEELLD